MYEWNQLSRMYFQIPKLACPWLLLIMHSTMDSQETVSHGYTGTLNNKKIWKKGIYLFLAFKSTTAPQLLSIHLYSSLGISSMWKKDKLLVSNSYMTIIYKCCMCRLYCNQHSPSSKILGQKKCSFKLTFPA